MASRTTVRSPWAIPTEGHLRRRPRSCSRPAGPHLAERPERLFATTPARFSCTAPVPRGGIRQTAYVGRRIFDRRPVCALEWVVRSEPMREATRRRTMRTAAVASAGLSGGAQRRRSAAARLFRLSPCSNSLRVLVDDHDLTSAKTAGPPGGCRPPGPGGRRVVSPRHAAPCEKTASMHQCAVGADRVCQLGAVSPYSQLRFPPVADRIGSCRQHRHCRRSHTSTSSTQ